MRNVTSVIPPKRKNTVYCPACLLRIGKIIILIEHPIQLRVVANGTILAGIISGQYNQTVGPSVTP